MLLLQQKIAQIRNLLFSRFMGFRSLKKPENTFYVHLKMTCQPCECATEISIGCQSLVQLLTFLQSWQSHEISNRNLASCDPKKMKIRKNLWKKAF